jgi:putative transposase
MSEKRKKPAELARVPNQLLGDVRRMIEGARAAVASAVNAGLTMLYWQIGQRIGREILRGTRAEYGTEIVSALARQLTTEYGRGFSEKSLRHMIRFAEAFADEGIVSALMRQWNGTPFPIIVSPPDVVGAGPRACPLGPRACPNEEGQPRGVAPRRRGPCLWVNAMKYDPKKHHRRSIRLVDYDYVQAGAYFVTVCAEDHTCLFGDVVGSEMRLNDAGRTVQTAWDEIPGHYPAVETDAFVVMPNHIHAIIVLSPDSVGAEPRVCPLGLGAGLTEEGQPQGVAPTNDVGQPVGAGPRARPLGPRARPNEKGQPRGVAPTERRALSLADVVQRFKSLTTKRYADGVRQQGWRAFPGRLWQRNYFEHIIRNDYSLDQIRLYITSNPASWALDRENPEAECYGQEEEQP